MLTRKPLRAVLFDWDGTLLDSFHADANAYAGMFRSLGMRWSPESLLRHYSPDWHNVYRAMRLPVERWPEADRLWRHFYRSERPLLQPGARQVVQMLAHRFRLGLVSGGSSLRVRSQIRRFGLGPFFEVSVFGDEAPRRKPHPLPVTNRPRQTRARSSVLHLCGRRAGRCKDGPARGRARRRRRRSFAESPRPARIAARCADQDDSFTSGTIVALLMSGNRLGRILA